MNRLKAVFVTAYTAVAFATAVIALAALVFGDARLAWLGAFGSVAPYVTLYLWTTFFKNMPRTRRYLPVSSTISIASALLAVYDNVVATASSPIAMLLAIIGCVGFLLYNFWYSSYGRRINPLLDLGKALPRFTAEDHAGGSVSTDQLRGKPVLLMFFRGNWCPFCMAQVQELTSRYRDLIDRGVQVTLISPQPHDFTKRVAEQYGVPFQFWVDVGNRAAMQLGIAVKDGVPVGMKDYDKDTVMPTVIITDADGKIIYTDQTNNYRVRPDPEDFIRVLNTHGL